LAQCPRLFHAPDQCVEIAGFLSQLDGEFGLAVRSTCGLAGENAFTLGHSHDIAAARFEASFRLAPLGKHLQPLAFQTAGAFEFASQGGCALANDRHGARENGPRMHDVAQGAGLKRRQREGTIAHRLECAREAGQRFAPLGKPGVESAALFFHEGQFRFGSRDRCFRLLHACGKGSSFLHRLLFGLPRFFSLLFEPLRPVARIALLLPGVFQRFARRDGIRRG
jgi:hypothetical protein